MWTIVYKQYILIIINSFRHQNKLPLRGKFFTKTHSTTPSEVLSCPFQLHSSTPNSCADSVGISLYGGGSVPHFLLRAAVDRRFFRPKHPPHSRQSLLHVLYCSAVRGPSHPGGTVSPDPRALLPLRRGSWPLLAGAGVCRRQMPDRRSGRLSN